ncbi:SDR family NAD(P)-dependent oxidoreductase [Candidimonas humi]|uniref:SDR family NAD(P)-dependent oxidoreductase n=1 Tax=Candidimonas humi TaxID=683355 RepID=A0ABV8NSJ1_9BURK|nr:SDR family NAD(P)-dependent oxidoreductase [Candidimonas humi]MBV6307044.1 SDR family NAD(P)-dependent oxidoreductase [Candidimonas humi]
MSKQLQSRVAIVTGAGGGLGRSHALELARHGARVVVNDLGAGARAVADEIRLAGGEAVACAGDVTRYEDMQSMAELAIAEFGRIDILVNNAGILRDRTFAKMPLDDFRLVLDVHVMGSVHAAKAVWPRMQAQNYGRIVMTTSSSGLYGNFGQSNYGAAKMALVGLMQALALEGARHDIRVNCLAPSAATAMTEGLLPEDAAAVMTPERVSPALLALAGDAAPTRMILLAGGGSYECAHITMTRGIHIDDAAGPAETLCRRLAEVQAQAGQFVPDSGWDQPRHELAKARGQLE